MKTSAIFSVLSSLIALTSALPTPKPQITDKAGNPISLPEGFDLSILNTPVGWNLVLDEPSFKKVYAGKNTEHTTPELVFEDTAGAPNGQILSVLDRLVPGNENLNSPFFTLNTDSSSDPKDSTVSFAAGTPGWPNRNGKGSLFLANDILTYGEPEASRKAGKRVEEAGFIIKTSPTEKDVNDEFVRFLGRYVADAEGDKHLVRDVWAACRIIDGIHSGAADERYNIRWFGKGGLEKASPKDKGVCTYVTINAPFSNGVATSTGELVTKN